MDANYTDQGIDPETGLKLRERLFADCFLTHLNATRAYQDAGYAADSHSSARVSASQLLSRPNIREYVDQKMVGRLARLGVSSEVTLRELCVVAYSRIDHYRVNPVSGALEVLPGVPEECLAAVRSFRFRRLVTEKQVDGRPVRHETLTTEIVLWDKLKALETLCKHLGLVAAELPPLEVLFNRLPPPVAALLRQLIASPPPPTPVPVPAIN